MESLKAYNAIYTREPLTEFQFNTVANNLKGTMTDIFKFSMAKIGMLIFLKEGVANDWGYNPDKDRDNRADSLQVDAKTFVHFVVTGSIPSNLTEDSSVPTLGAKYDGGKLNFRAFSRGLAKPIKAIAAVLTYGCEKYAEDSWQQVPNGKARYESALDRHMNAWKDGEKYDEESGLPHLAHAACNMMFVLWFELTDGSLDDKDYTTYNKPPVRG